MFTVALLCIACAAYWLWRHMNAKSTEPPYLPEAWPIVGHVPLLIGDSSTVTDPDDCFTVANKCLEKDPFYGFAKPWLGHGLITARYLESKLSLGLYFRTPGPPSHHINVPQVGQNLKLDGKKLDAITETVFLGITLDSRLQWGAHIRALSGRLSSAAYAVRKIRQLAYEATAKWTQQHHVVRVTDVTNANFIYETFDKAVAELTYQLIDIQTKQSWRDAIWKDHRKLLNPAFSQILLDTFMGVFNSQSRKLVKDLEKEVGKGPFNHWTYTRNNALETICLTSLGVDYTDSNLNSKYVEALELILKVFKERFIKPWWHTTYTFKFSKLKKKQDACLEILHNMSYTVLQNGKSKLNGNTCAERSITPGTKFKPFIDLILELSIEKGVFSDKEIREHVDTILLAGHETSANVLMFTMILLGSHPEAQEKVFAEIQEVLEGDRDVEKMHLSKLVYVEAVLKESMRLFTIVPLLARKLNEDVKLKNYTLSAGRTCCLLYFRLHKHPIWGPDAEEFKPERWLEPGRLPSNPNAFAAFSLGKRNCIAKFYALMSMKTTLAHVVRCYRIKADHTKLRLTADMALKPVAGHYISIERRT